MLITTSIIYLNLPKSPPWKRRSLIFHEVCKAVDNGSTKIYFLKLWNALFSWKFRHRNVKVECNYRVICRLEWELTNWTIKIFFISFVSTVRFQNSRLTIWNDFNSQRSVTLWLVYSEVLHQCSVVYCHYDTPLFVIVEFQSKFKILLLSHFKLN